MPKRFERRKEDFICAHCGAEVKGNGYTNHCPECLWSKHVDVNPGDRAATCGGIMKPFSYEKKGKEISIVHRCTKCGVERRVKSVEDDDFEKIIALGL